MQNSGVLGKKIPSGMNRAYFRVAGILDSPIADLPLVFSFDDKLLEPRSSDLLPSDADFRTLRGTGA